MSNRLSRKLADIFKNIWILKMFAFCDITDLFYALKKVLLQLEPGWYVLREYE